MKGLDLSVVEQETGLGIITQKNLRPRLFCREAVKKAKILRGQITHVFSFRDWHVFVKLYKQYIWTDLEFALPV